MPFKHLAYHFPYAFARAIELPGVGGLLQGCGAPHAVALVAFTQFLQKGANISIDSFFFQLLMPPLRTLFGARCQEHLEERVREHHRAHVAAVCNEARRGAKCSLALEQRCSNRGQRSYPGGAFAAVLAADRVCNTLAEKKYFSLLKGGVEIARPLRERRLVVEPGCLFHRC